MVKRKGQGSKRVIVGTWRTRADWDGWHHDPTFAETRQRLGDHAGHDPLGRPKVQC